MEKKEGMISFIKQLFANNQTEEESLEKIDNIDEETRKELEKSYKHIDAMMEKYRIENFEVNQKEKVPSVKKARLEKVQINPGSTSCVRDNAFFPSEVILIIVSSSSFVI